MKLAKTYKYQILDDKNGVNAGNANARQVDADLIQVFNALSGRIRFGTGTTSERGENIAGRFLSVTTNGSVDTEDAFAHGLGSTPVGFLVLNKDRTK